MLASRESGGRSLRPRTSPWPLAMTLTLLALVTWVGRAPAMRLTAHLWIVADPPAPADAIVILGGGWDWRSRAAARLYRQGLAPVILVTQPRPRPVDSPDREAREIEWTRQLLAEERVPASAIQLLAPKVGNTFDEARALAAWARDHRARRILIPTDLFHTRRARWIMQRQLRSLNTDIRMIPVTYAGVEAENWWENDRGFSDFQKETLKFAFYRLRF